MGTLSEQLSAHHDNHQLPDPENDRGQCSGRDTQVQGRIQILCRYVEYLLRDEINRALRRAAVLTDKNLLSSR